MLTAVCPRTRQALPQRMDIPTTESGVGSGESETLQIVPRSSGELSPTASDKKIVLMTVEAFEQIVPVTIVRTIFMTMDTGFCCLRVETSANLGY